MSNESIVRCETEAQFRALPMRDRDNATKIIVDGRIWKNRKGPVGGRE